MKRTWLIACGVVLIFGGCQSGAKPEKESFLCAQARGTCRAFVEDGMAKHCDADADCEAAFIDCGEKACEVPVIIGRKPLLSDKRLATYQKLRGAALKECGETSAAAAGAACPHAPIQPRCVNKVCVK